jgi:hypothetical protein
MSVGIDAPELVRTDEAAAFIMTLIQSLADVPPRVTYTTGPPGVTGAPVE